MLNEKNITPLLLNAFNNQLKAYTQEFQQVFNCHYEMNFFIQAQKEIIGPANKLLLGPNAAAFYDEKQSSEKTSNFKLLFTEPLIIEIISTFYYMLRSPKIFPEIGDITEESNNLSDAILPKNKDRREYARLLAEIALEFAFYHEFSHIIYGHLDEMFSHHKIASLYAVSPASRSKSVINRKKKLYELDADINAIVFLVNAFKTKRKLLEFSQYSLNSLEDFYFSLGVSITILFRMIERWRRETDPIYSIKHTDHPHPDIRDSIITAYIKTNASQDVTENKKLHSAYDKGRESAINIIADLDYFIPTFEITTHLGHAEAMQELNWISDELNTLRNNGITDMDLRRLHKKLKANQIINPLE